MRSRSLIVFQLLLSASMLFPARLQAVTKPADTAESDRRSIRLDEFGVGSGYAWGGMVRTGESLEVVPAYVRVGFDINPLFGMQESASTLQLAFEPFVNTIIEPDEGVEAGLNVFIRYLHPLTSSVKLVAEMGSGPVYLSIDTREQGDAGLNFLNQFGLGAQVALGERSALTMGYRFRHLSNASISSPNRGINSDAIMISYSIRY
ncbi:MAG: acyloxyacyl hydrolase [Chlorobiaceae bacterium]|nr:acyloxyacyl hydrolase [Chlorobiaceae bacterium]NTW73380.1 acyloxyacyl hydrolase [Chlorobiaceae bacterium]